MSALTTPQSRLLQHFSSAKHIFLPQKLKQEYKKLSVSFFYYSHKMVNEPWQLDESANQRSLAGTVANKRGRYTAGGVTSCQI